MFFGTVTRLLNLLLRFGVFFAGVLSAQVPSSTPAVPGATAAVPTHTCRVITTPASPGDNQLAASDYKAAETTFRAVLAKEPASEEARLGLVRALMGEDRVQEAQTESAAMLHDKPKSSVAEIAASEAAYRAGALEDALAHAQAGVRDDPCEARGYAADAAVLDLTGYYATATRFLDQAHRLRPNDEVIRRDWLQTLPRKEREAELSRYLDGPHALSDDDTHGYGNELAHLKARRPGECRVRSKAESASLPLQLVYGDHSYPIAFGLDVLFNNTKRRMQIDTGASGIVLTQSAARALKLEPEYAFKTGGVGDDGMLDSYLAHVHSIRIGDVEVADCMVEVVNKSKLDVDGLIGMDVFNRWLVTLNYAEAQVRLDPLPRRPGAPTPTPADAKAALDDTGDDDTPRDRYIAPEMKDWGRVLRIGHEILLPAFYRKEGSRTHYLIMDTGADVTSLSSSMAREGGKLHGSAMQFVGLSGKVKKVYEIDPTSLVVANLILPTSGYYAYDMTGLSHNSGFELSGLLGLPTLQRLTIQIDYRDNLIHFGYDPKHDMVRFHAGSN